MAIGTTPSAHGCSPRERPSYSYAGPYFVAEAVVRLEARYPGTDFAWVHNLVPPEQTAAAMEVLAKKLERIDKHGILSLDALNRHLVTLL